MDKDICYMDKDKSNVYSSNYLSISLWDPPEESTYYDRKMDFQGKVPGSSLEEAKKNYEREYGISLDKE